MGDEYREGYEAGRKDERSVSNRLLLQVGITVAAVTAGLALFNPGRDVRHQGTNYAEPRNQVVVPHTPRLLDENDPYKYNPNPSKAPTD